MSQILWCFLRVWRADISVLSQVRILYVNEKEKRYKRNIMFLFAEHSDKPLKSLISIAHEENNICLYRFSFNLRYEWLVRGRLYLPNQHHESHHKICNLRYGTHGYLWILPLITWIDGFPQPEYCMLHSLGLIKNRTDLFSGSWERPVLRKQTLRFQKTI